MIDQQSKSETFARPTSCKGIEKETRVDGHLNKKNSSIEDRITREKS